MVHNKVHHKFHVTFLQLGDQFVKVSDTTIDGVNGLVVCNVIAHVCLGALVDLEMEYISRWW